MTHVPSDMIGARHRVVGEVIDCDTCLDPGLIHQGEDVPAGWLRDTNGRHCPKCQ